MPNIVATIAVTLFPLLMAFAASSDLLTMRISNVLVLVLFVSFLVVALYIGMPLDQIGTRLMVGGITLLVGFAFFAFGWVGGGDAKFVAVTAMWIGLTELLPYLLYAALLGGALTLMIIAVRQWPLPIFLAKISWIGRLHDAQSKVPYGIALAGAGMLVYTRTDIFMSLVA